MKNPINIHFIHGMKPFMGKHVGDLEVIGKGWADSINDPASYEYELSEVWLLTNGQRVPYLDIICSIFTDPVEYEDLDKGIFAHMMFEYGVKDYDETTDRSQDINIFGQEPYKSVA